LTKAIQEQQAEIEALNEEAATAARQSPEPASNIAAPLADGSQVGAVGQRVGGPSSHAVWALAGAVFAFALGLFAVAGAFLRCIRPAYLA
jgi:hypothetical protein